MKKLFLFTVLFICSFTFAQTSSKKLATNFNNSKSNLGLFSFENETLNYGTVKQNSDGKRTFTFTNTGKSPIIITNVKGSCGCTVATKPNKPIMPNESAEIGISYATSRLGKFNKTITVTSNATESRKILRIKGTVIK